jgi:acetoin utilization protein AcuB
MFVKLWMTENPATIRQSQSLAEADQTMRRLGVRRLPVVDDESNLIGVITRTDFLRAIPFGADEEDAAGGDQTPVAAYMTASPITVDPMEPLETAAHTMRKNKVSGLPVVTADGGFVGIITEADIGRALMDILGVGKGGARIEMQTGKTAGELYKAFEIFKDFNMTVRSVAVYPDFSETHQLLTIRVQGEKLEDLLDALWKTGNTIHRIMVFDEEG